MRADRLRKIREKQGYTQEELAEIMGEPTLQIWRWENSKTIPNGKKLAKIAKTLNVSADYLLGLSDDLMPTLHESDLSAKERAIVIALRHGNTNEAIRMIVGDQP